ncbi:MAG: glycoside hydrolase family 43 protein, partial [Clostridiales bacterium]|nr:glycoside hydrolase family 43 protein [Clostridiales bacterium]
LYARKGIQTIDGDISFNAVNGFYYLYFKHDEDQTIAYVKSKNLTGPYEDKPVTVSFAPSGVEGSSIYNITGTDTWVMIMDEYGKRRFFAQQTTDMENFLPLEPTAYSFDGVRPRHGSVMAISDAEYETLVSAFGISE